MYDSFSVSMNLDWDQSPYHIKVSKRGTYNFRKVQHLV